MKFTQLSSTLLTTLLVGESFWHDSSARLLQVVLATAFISKGWLLYFKPGFLEFFGLKLIGLDGLTEIQAIRESFIGVYLYLTTCLSALSFGSCFLFGRAIGRLLALRRKESKLSNVHLKVALAEFFGGISCLIFYLKERNAKQVSDLAVTNLYRRQHPDPQHLQDYVPYCQENLQNPYPFYNQLRKDAPVYKPLGLDYYLISRAEDIMSVCKHPEIYSSNLASILIQGQGGRSSNFDITHMLSSIGFIDSLAIQDPPVHTIERKFVSTGLSPRLFESIEYKIRDKARFLLESFKVRSVGDWMDQVALRLPMQIALELCGFQCDYETAKEVKEKLDHSVSLLNGTNTPDEFLAHVQEAMKVFFWIRNQLTEVLDSDVENQTDLMKSLSKGLQQRELSVAEVESMVFQILAAGNDSSAATMGHAMKILCDRQDIQAELRKDLSLIPTFIEEILRFESPFSGHFRKVLKETHLAGVNLKPGDRLMLLWGSANRDESFWENPNEFRMDRGSKGRSHFSFGHGIHTCLGNNLAKREVRIVLEEVLKAFSSIQQAKHAPKFYYVPSSFTRSLARYHVELH